MPRTSLGHLVTTSEITFCFYLIVCTACHWNLVASCLVRTHC